MRKHVVVVHTRSGFRYAHFIVKEVNLLGVRCGSTAWQEVDGYLDQGRRAVEDTLIHFRATGPRRTTPKARALESRGFRVVNSSEVLERTGDKALSYEWGRKHGFELPLTKEGSKSEIKGFVSELGLEKFVIKPVTSKSQGAYCFQSYPSDPDFPSKLSQVLGREVIVQEFVDYLRIYRVIVIGGRVLDSAVFSDEPRGERWKVSVCLNPEMQLVKRPDNDLLEYALKIAEVFGTEIGFIDVFQTEDGYVLSEINTACSLILHERMSRWNISREIAQYLVSQL